MQTMSAVIISRVCAGECLENIRRVVESRLSPVSREITDSRLKTREELEALKLKMISYILLRSSMGSPTDAGAVQEATGVTLTLELQSECGDAESHLHFSFILEIEFAKTGRLNR